MKIRVGIIGATGYAGEELIEILLRHSEVEITVVTASADLEKEELIGRILPRLAGRLNLECFSLNVERVLPMVDVLFLALPHTVSQNVAIAFLEAGKKVIDLSADFRLRDPAIYQKWYHAVHQHEDYLAKAVYGLTELNAEKIHQAKLVANPGCYPTGAILALAPLVKERLAQPGGVVIDAKSGATGAGKKPSLFLHFPEVHDNLKAYKVNTHQHIPEIEQELSLLAGEEIRVLFTPHLLPVNRGILTTSYVRLRQMVSLTEIEDLYREFYEGASFVRLHPSGSWPELADVTGTNFCDLGFTVHSELQTVIVISAIDNLVKGAAGQAVQNLNCMFGWNQKTALLP